MHEMFAFFLLFIKYYKNLNLTPSQYEKFHYNETIPCF